MPDTATRGDRLKAAHDKLQSAVEEIVSGDDWKRMLETAAKFHRYSFNNQLLIFCQRPDATQVAGFNRWKSAIASAAARFVLGEYNTIVEGGIGPWFLDPFMTVAQECDFALNYVIVRPEGDVALGRALERTDGGLNEEGPVLHLHEEFSSLGEFERHVVDSSAMSPEETAAVLRSGMEDGRFRLVRV